VTVSGDGIAQASIDFTAQINALGLNHGLLDLRSIRIVPYSGYTPGSPIPYAESYSTMLHDGETTSGWSVNDDGFVVPDHARYTQGSIAAISLSERRSGV
jgi:hypothetical protein